MLGHGKGPTGIGAEVPNGVAGERRAGQDDDLAQPVRCERGHTGDDK